MWRKQNIPFKLQVFFLKPFKLQVSGLELGMQLEYFVLLYKLYIIMLMFQILCIYFLLYMHGFVSLFLKLGNRIVCTVHALSSNPVPKTSPILPQPTPPAAAARLCIHTRRCRLAALDSMRGLSPGASSLPSLPSGRPIHEVRGEESRGCAAIPVDSPVSLLRAAPPAIPIPSRKRARRRMASDPP